MKETEYTEDYKYYLVTFFIYLSIFIQSYIFFKEPFEFQFGYLIYILLLPGFFRRHRLSRPLVLIFLILLIVGLVNILFDNNTIQLFLKVFTGMSLSYFFYYYVLVQFEFNIEQLFKWYLKGAYICSIIGFIQLFFYLINYRMGWRFWGFFNKHGESFGGLTGFRINSIFCEPAHLAGILSAAFFISLYNLTKKEGVYINKFKSIVIVSVYILSFSSLGQAGILIAIVLLFFSYGIIKYLIVVVPIILIAFNFIYDNVPEFRQRYDSAIELVQGEKFILGKTHGSSFILYNNYVVATENFKTNFLFGTGIGSHAFAFKIHSLSKDIKQKGFDSNSADANSMFLRLLSETGLFGIIIFIYIIITGYVKRDPKRLTYHWLISNAILLMILLNLFRQGHYFLYGFPFFMFLYYFNGTAYKDLVNGNPSEHDLYLLDDKKN
jgi:hypothetical protein